MQKDRPERTNRNRNSFEWMWNFNRWGSSLQYGLPPHSLVFYLTKVYDFFFFWPQGSLNCVLSQNMSEMCSDTNCMWANPIWTLVSHTSVSGCVWACSDTHILMFSWYCLVSEGWLYRGWNIRWNKQLFSVSYHIVDCRTERSPNYFTLKMLIITHMTGEPVLWSVLYQLHR